MNDKEKIGDLPLDTVKQYYKKGIEESLGTDIPEDSKALGKWGEEMKAFWENPIENLEESIKEHEEMIEKHKEQIERNKEVIEKKREMIENYKEYIKNHKKAINRIETWIENIKMDMEEEEADKNG